MKRLGKEFLVGCLVLGAIGLAIVFGWLMGVVNPLRSEHRYHVFYAFAGGVELGSPVRVSGVKVGKVERVEFLTDAEAKGFDSAAGDPPPTLRLTVTVADRATRAVRRDSRFFVNMAGIIGERYIEVSPGSASAPELENGARLRGIDPPRIDQLLSQGYNVFAKVQEFIEKNEHAMSDLLKQTDHLLGDLNKALKGGDKQRLLTLVDNLSALSSESRRMLQKLEEREARAFFERLQGLTERAYSVDKPALKKFLQDEGVRVKIF